MREGREGKQEEKRRNGIKEGERGGGKGERVEGRETF